MKQRFSKLLLTLILGMDLCSTTSAQAAVELDLGDDGMYDTDFIIWQHNTNHLGYNDWRLPTSSQHDISSSDHDHWEGDWNFDTVDGWRGMPRKSHHKYARVVRPDEQTYASHSPTIPEPEAYALLVAGLVLLIFTAKHRRHNS